MPIEIERLYREHHAGLVRLVERELRDHHDAEDVVQTAFLDAQRAIERGTIPHNPPAWLATIALNAGRRLRRRRLNAEPLEEYAVHEASRVPEIRAALSSLPREQRTAVVYRDLLGYSYGETAEQMGTSVNAVTMLLHRGRKRLRQTLGVTTGGLGLWRWLRRAGMQQVAVAKGTAAVVVAAGLATTGAVAARVVASQATVRAAAAAPTTRAERNGTREAAGTHARAVAPGSARRRAETAGGSRASTPARAASHVSAAAPPSAVPASTTAAHAPPSSSTLGLPTVSVPTVSLPALSIPAAPTIAVTATTPVATVTVATSTATTATVTTPIVTVTVPLP